MRRRGARGHTQRMAKSAFHRIGGSAHLLWGGIQSGMSISTWSRIRQLRRGRVAPRTPPPPFGTQAPAWSGCEGRGSRPCTCHSVLERSTISRVPRKRIRGGQQTDSHFGTARLHRYEGQFYKHGVSSTQVSLPRERDDSFLQEILRLRLCSSHNEGPMIARAAKAKMVAAIGRVTNVE